MQLEMGHRLSLRHHQSSSEQEQKQLVTVQKRRDEQTKAQHNAELVSQQEYTERARLELKRRHVMETKQLPKNLKARESCFILYLLLYYYNILR